jgi:hypothetical protein
MEICWVAFYPKGVHRYEEFLAGRFPEWFLELTLVHELFHCIQFAAVADTARVATEKMRQWVIEGSAEWAGYKYAHDVTGIPYDKPLPGLQLGASENWDQYLGKPEDSGPGTPQKSIFTRSYGSVGFYAHIENSGQDPWATILRMVVASARPGSDHDRDVAAFEEAHRTPTFLSRWAMGMVRQPKFGPNWSTTGPDISEYVPVLEDHAVAASQLSFDVVEGATDRHRVTFQTSDDMIMILDTTASKGGLYWDSGSFGVEEEFPKSFPPTSRAICLDKGGCSCPAGQAYSGQERLESLPAPGAGSLVIAFTGGSSPGKVTLQFRQLPCAPAAAATCSDGTSVGAQSTGGFIQSQSTVTDLLCPTVTCSAEAQQRANELTGAGFPEGDNTGKPRFTSGCYWSRGHGGPNHSHLGLGRLIPRPEFDSIQAFTGLERSNGYACAQADAEGHVTCGQNLDLLPCWAQVEKWFGPGNVLSLELQLPNCNHPVALAERLMEQLPR